MGECESTLSFLAEDFDEIIGVFRVGDVVFGDGDEKSAGFF
jgi:hypothetical protein